MNCFSYFQRLSKKKFLFISIIVAASLGVTFYLLSPRRLGTPRHIYASLAPETIPGKNITLKKPKEEYFLAYHNMLSPTVRKHFEYPEHITIDFTIYTLRERIKGMMEDKTLFYFIFDNKENKLIGGIEVRSEDSNGQLGCWLNEHYWGGGRIQEALALISRTFFDLKPDKEFIAHVRLWNKRSYHALKKFGFQEIGYIYENGKPNRYLLKYERKQLSK